jgi:hypothetical protein
MEHELQCYYFNTKITQGHQEQHVMNVVVALCLCCVICIMLVFAVCVYVML